MHRFKSYFHLIYNNSLIIITLICVFLFFTLPFLSKPFPSKTSILFFFKDPLKGMKKNKYWHFDIIPVRSWKDAKTVFVLAICSQSWHTEFFSYFRIARVSTLPYPRRYDHLVLQILYNYFIIRLNHFIFFYLFHNILSFYLFFNHSFLHCFL